MEEGVTADRKEHRRKREMIERKEKEKSNCLTWRVVTGFIV
jgi:hypothetical protein